MHLRVAELHVKIPPAFRAHRLCRAKAAISLATIRLSGIMTFRSLRASSMRRFIPASTSFTTAAASSSWWADQNAELRPPFGL